MGVRMTIDINNSGIGICDSTLPEAYSPVSDIVVIIADHDGNYVIASSDSRNICKIRSGYGNRSNFCRWNGCRRLRRAFLRRIGLFFSRAFDDSIGNKSIANINDCGADSVCSHIEPVERSAAQTYYESGNWEHLIDNGKCDLSYKTNR